MTVVLDSGNLSAVLLRQVLELLQSFPGDIPVRLCLSDPAGDSMVIVSAGAEYKVAPTPALRQSLAALAGVLDVTVSSEADS